MEATLPDWMVERFVQPRPDCWIWTGATDRGYGRVWIEGTAKRVHRVVYEALRGPIPEGLTLDHLCRVRACCNPDHLEPVTAAVNLERAVRPRRIPSTGKPGKPRKPRLLALECGNGHPYSPENTVIRANGTRRCRICNRSHQATYRQRKRALRAVQ